jgi:hypothetical protein
MTLFHQPHQSTDACSSIHLFPQHHRPITHCHSKSPQPTVAIAGIMHSRLHTIHCLPLFEVLVSIGLHAFTPCSPLEGSYLSMLTTFCVAYSSLLPIPVDRTTLTRHAEPITKHSCHQAPDRLCYRQS